MSEKHVSQFDSPLAALRHRREMDSLGASAGVDTVLDAVGSGLEKLGVPGAGLFRKALKSGQTPIETLVDQLEAAAFDEICQIRRHIEGHDERLRQFDERLQRQEAQGAYLSAIFHGLRTSDPEKRARLGTLAINCIFLNDTKPESLDGMMRGAVELTEKDILELGEFCSRQSQILADAEKSQMHWYENVRNNWQRWIVERSTAFRVGKLSYIDHAGSRPRLAAHGFIVAIPPRGTSNSEEVPYALLPEGKRFYERLSKKPPGVPARR